jgi:hypothetical protein
MGVYAHARQVLNTQETMDIGEIRGLQQALGRLLTECFRDAIDNIGESGTGYIHLTFNGTYHCTVIFFFNEEDEKAYKPLPVVTDVGLNIPVKLKDKNCIELQRYIVNRTMGAISIND